LDTNVWISGLIFGGTPGQILSLALFGSLTVCISAPLVDELRRMLKDCFEWTEQDLTESLTPLLEQTELVTPGDQMHVAADPDDNRILECAVAARASVIVTGDDHLLRLRSFRDIHIVTPRSFLNTLTK
jgi:putative PIN family toxin of toxin-antitoxin system